MAEEAEETEAEKNFSALTTAALLEGPGEDFLVEVEEVVDLGTEVVEENEVVVSTDSLLSSCILYRVSSMTWNIVCSIVGVRHNLVGMT